MAGYFTFRYSEGSGGLTGSSYEHVDFIHRGRGPSSFRLLCAPALIVFGLLVSKHEPVSIARPTSCFPAIFVFLYVEVRSPPAISGRSCGEIGKNTLRSCLTGTWQPANQLVSCTRRARHSASSIEKIKSNSLCCYACWGHMPPTRPRQGAQFPSYKTVASKSKKGAHAPYSKHTRQKMNFKSPGKASRYLKGKVQAVHASPGRDTNVDRIIRRRSPRRNKSH